MVANPSVAFILARETEVVIGRNDIDLLFVAENEAGCNSLKEEVRGICQTMWDIGLRVSPADGDSAPGPDPGPRSGADGRPARVRARSTWVNFAVNAPAPVDDVGIYLVADFDDVLTWCDDERWRISERRIIPVFRDPSRAPVA